MDLQEALEKEFGVSELVIKTVQADGHKYSLRQMDWYDLEKANSIIFNRESGLTPPRGEGADGEEPVMAPDPMMVALRTQLGIVSVAVAAIDDIPIWKIFKVVPDEAMVGRNPLDPPPSVKFAAADRLANLFAKGKKLGVVKFLWEFYAENLDTDVIQQEADRPSTPS